MMQPRVTWDGEAQELSRLDWSVGLSSSVVTYVGRASPLWVVSSLCGGLGFYKQTEGWAW